VNKKQKNNAYQKKHRASKTSTNEKDIEFTISKFHELTAQGPLYICTCCHQLWYKNGVLSAKNLRQSNSNMSKFLCNKRSVDNVEWLCKTCHRHLISNKIPPCAVVNGMVFPQKPDFFDLNELECRLLAPRIAFQKLMQAPTGKQLKIHGNIVNVPADVTSTVTMLLWLPCQTETIKVNLKRKLQFKSSALSLNIRPHKVVQAAQWLMNNSSLYKDEGIVFNPEWANQYNQGTTHEEEVFDEQSAVLTESSSDTDSEILDNENDWREHEACRCRFLECNSWC